MLPEHMGLYIWTAFHSIQNKAKGGNKIKIRTLSLEETKSNKPVFTLYNPLSCHRMGIWAVSGHTGQSVVNFHGSDTPKGKKKDSSRG
jgi:hypothetical protein